MIKQLLTNNFKQMDEQRNDLKNKQDALRLRVLQAKAKLTGKYSRSLTALMVERYPEYDTHRGSTKLSNFLSLKTVNEHMVEQLEQLINDFKNK